MRSSRTTIFGISGILNLVVWCLVAGIPIRAAELSGDEANLLPSPSFEAAEGGRPVGWATRVWAGEGDFAHVESGRSGGRSVEVTSGAGGDLSWSATVSVEPHSAYRLSGWIRTENLQPGTGRGALLNVHEMSGAATTAVTGTSDWRHVETLVRTGQREQITVNCLFGGWGQSTGTAWFDDVRLEKIDLANLQPVVTLHADRTGAPINPFIYGQFIEHLGRCIYGGIWAEMLEDRKFYFPITADYNPYRGPAVDHPDFIPVVGASPWETLGPAESVTMVDEDSFVGRHTPRVAAGSGIRQRDLGLVAGKRYDGYVWLKACEGAATVEVALVWGEESDARQVAAVAQVGRQYAQYPLTLTAGASTDEAMLEIRVSGGPVLIGTASLMPADNVRGMRADTLALLQQLGGTMYRWPGGNFVSGYDWRDGIGPRDRRPPRMNPAWTGVEHNDFGMDEFLDFCRTIGAEPVITVNTGFGDAYSAAQQVEYANSPADTIGGGWRVKNGHPQPYGVEYWCVGNEMWGPWQLGFMQLSHYTQKHNLVAEAMWKADPALRLVASGQMGTINERHDPNERRGWSHGMLEQCADWMNYISEHFYHGKNQSDLTAHVGQLANSVRQKAEAHRRLQAELGLIPDQLKPIAMTEWNYWHQPYVYGELGCVYDLSDALGVAAGLHEYFRQSDIIAMAHYAQTVNVIGCIKTTKTEAFFDSTALPLMLYRREFGTVPVELSGDHQLLGIDAAAAWTDDRQAVTVGLVNPNREAKEIVLNIEGAELGGDASAWLIAGDDPRATNDPRSQPLRIVDLATPLENGRLRLPPLSIMLVKMSVK